MFSSLCKNRIPINQKLREYCMKSTNESIRKLTEKYNEERKSNKIKVDKLIKNDLPNPEDNNDFIFSVICLLSSTTFLYYFYKAYK